MSFVNVAPEMVAAAVEDLAGIGSSISAANAAAVALTTDVVPAAADEVSAAIAALFGSHAREYQAISAQSAAFHERLVQTLRSGASAYLGTELANAQQNLLNAVNGPTQAWLGRPLIGNGTDGAAGTGQAGGAGGIL